MNEYFEDRKEQGFTLIELLVAIVVVGILTAVAIVGIAGLTNKGAKSACAATADAIEAAQAVHFANSNAYPANFGVMLSTSPPELTLSGGATPSPSLAAATTITGSGGWSIDVNTAGTATAPLTITKNNC
jgi:prepilin-type N-terminal cleavage/methylation domain-containing protein